MHCDSYSLSRWVSVLLQSYLFLVKDPMSLENEFPFSGSGSNLILKLVPSDG